MRLQLQLAIDHLMDDDNHQVVEGNLAAPDEASWQKDPYIPMKAAKKAIDWQGPWQQRKKIIKIQKQQIHELKEKVATNADIV